MTHIQLNPKSAALPAALLCLASLFCLGLLATPSAEAAQMEQVCTFAGSAAPVSEEKIAEDEEVQLGGVGGMAVNYTGAGGVPAGTVYAAGKTLGQSLRIAMFTPEAEGCPKFSVAWEVPSEAVAYERCGPLLGLEGEKAKFPCQPRVIAGAAKIDVDVDQATGNVYVLSGEIGTAGRKMVVEYTADGSEEITRFGEKAASGKTTAETSTQIHESPYPGGLAVNGAGEVYVFDSNVPPADDFYHRLMVFRPQTPGDFEHYVYAGEVAAGFGGAGKLPANPVTDAAGNVYVAGAGEEYIEEYAPETPSTYPGSAAKPICSFEFPKGGITAITVNPESGEVFFFSLKKEAGFSFKLVHQLSPCDEGTGEFKEIGKFEVSPQRDDLYGLAFDPVREFVPATPPGAPARPAGMLYGGAPGPVPSSGVGKGEPGQSSLGYGFAPAEESPPVVVGESVRKVTAKGAQLHAVIEPKGFQSTYAFQYITESAFEAEGESFEKATEAPPGGAPLSGTGGTQSAAASIGGLAPDTEYRYRVVASSHCAPSEAGKVCETDGTALRFRTYPLEARALPDNRAWELVSPAQKNGGQVFPADPRVNSCAIIECKPGHSHHQAFPLQSTPDGEAVAYEGTSFAPGEGATAEDEYVARRTGAGWQSTNLTPAKLQQGSGYRALDPLLQKAVLEQSAPSLGDQAPSEYANIYTQPSAEPLTVTPLLVKAPPDRTSANGPEHFALSYAGASADLSRVFFAANDALTEVTPFAPEPPDPGASGKDLYEWSGGQLRLVNVAPGNGAVKAGASFGAGGAHAISADGSRAFWSDATGQTYVREDGEVTREIPDPGRFLAASPDGSKVLLEDGVLYDLESEASVDLSAGQGGFEGIAGNSEDLSRVYFVDTAVLSGEEENSSGAKAQVGKDNLYAWQEGSPTRFVATLRPQDNEENPSGGGGAVDWASVPSQRTAEASPDGRYLAFVSRALLSSPLPDYSNVGPCEEISGTSEFLAVPCPEVFLFDSTTGKLRCASCAPSGAAPLGWSVLRRLEGAGGSLPQPRYLGNSGRLFFDSQDALSGFDTNEGIEDVYQLEPAGVGGCEREGGCVGLISAGSEGIDSNFLASDESGKNVFFTTRDRLVGADSDELIDLYDAREGGGFASEFKPPPGEEQTQVIPSEPPSLPASETFSGPGNVKPKPRCKKGQVRRKGRCAQKTAHKRKAGKHRRRSKHKRRSAR